MDSAHAVSSYINTKTRLPPQASTPRCSGLACAPGAGEAVAGGLLGLAGQPVEPNW